LLPDVTVDSKGVSTNFTLTWMRMTYNWLQQAAAAGGACEPIIVDADDITLDQKLARKLVLALGGNPDELIFNWDVVEGADLDKVEPSARVFESILLPSQGVLENKSSAILTIEHEARGWADEFGKQIADKLITLR
jgi:hypothetical protein